MQPVSSQQYFTTLTVIHAALALGQVIFVTVVYFFVNAGQAPLQGVEATGQSWVYIVGGATILGVLTSAQIFGMQMQKLREKQALPEKMNGYRAATIARYALLEMPSLLAIVGYFLTNNLLLLIFTGLILLLFLIFRPTKERLIADLELSPAEQALVNDPNATVAESTSTGQ